MTNYQIIKLWGAFNYLLSDIYWKTFGIHQDPDLADELISLKPSQEASRKLFEDWICKLPKELLAKVYCKSLERLVCIKLGHLRPMEHPPQRFVCLLCGISKDIDPGYDGAFVASMPGDPEFASSMVDTIQPKDIASQDTMDLTKKELLAGAQSILMQLASQDGPVEEGHWGVSQPDEHGGWRYFYDGKECGTLDEAEVVERAYVLRQLAR